MIQITNLLFEDASFKNNFYLSQFKKIIFETDDINLVKNLILARFNINSETFDMKFKHESIKDFVEDGKDCKLFISKYQILWDQIYLENK